MGIGEILTFEFLGYAAILAAAQPLNTVIVVVVAKNSKAEKQVEKHIFQRVL